MRCLASSGFRKIRIPKGRARYLSKMTFDVIPLARTISLLQMIAKGLHMRCVGWGPYAGFLRDGGSDIKGDQIWCD
jgi:hypothetical protein